MNDELRELVSFAIMDGQNQIHDLKDGTATPEEITERMFKSLDYFTDKIQVYTDKAVKEARIDELENLAKKQQVFEGYGFDETGVDINDIEDRIAELQEGKE